MDSTLRLVRQRRSIAISRRSPSFSSRYEEPSSSSRRRKRRRCDVQRLRHRFQGRPLVAIEAAQAPPDPCHPTVGVLVAHEDRLRRIAQEPLEAGLVLHDRALQEPRVEPEAGLRRVEREVGREHGVVLGTVRRPGKGEGCARERDAPPGQPAYEPAQDDEKQLAGEDPRRRVGDAVGHAQSRFRPRDRQLPAQIVEDDRKAAQRLLDRPLQGAGVDQALAHEREAPALHPPGVRAEEFVVQLLRDRQPQRGEALRRDARVGGVEELRRQPRRAQDAVEPRRVAAQAGHRPAHEHVRDRAFLHRRRRAYSRLAKRVATVDASRHRAGAVSRLCFRPMIQPRLIAAGFRPGDHRWP